jgi:hypothetical protein
MAGLVPAISLRRAQRIPKRDRRDKPGDDTVRTQRASSNTQRNHPMGGQTTTTQSSSQQSQTQPWAAVLPQLQGLLGNLGNINTGVSPAQSAAAGALNSAAQARSLSAGCKEQRMGVACLCVHATG